MACDEFYSLSTEGTGTYDDSGGSACKKFTT